ncbi:MAG: GAF domain-containing protein [Candidatus Anammoxibacter sp.]
MAKIKTNKTAGKKISKTPKVKGSQQLQQMELLLAISRQMAAIETLDDVLKTFVDIAATETNSERGTLFLNDEKTGELYSRVALGNERREIRILNNSGIAGHVFTSGEGVIIHDAYADERFNSSVDKQTGFTTTNILCAPVRTVKGKIIGAIQTLNKKKGSFTKKDLALLESMTTQVAITLQNAQQVENMQKAKDLEMDFLNVVSGITTEIDLGTMLQKVMVEATKMLNADRSTLFLNDEKTNELFSRVAQGNSIGEIRLPNHLGIAGTVFTSGNTINIPYAYADMRFNPAFDKKTGYFTRSILCVPIINKDGKSIGVTQALNKRGGPFTSEDESRLKAFTSQVAIGLQNAKLFDDVQNMKNYNESMLESMSNGVITIDEEKNIVTCNVAGLRIMHVESENILNKKVEEFFIDPNAWVLEKIKRVEETHESDISIDAELEFGEEKLSVNLTILPLKSGENKILGTMIMMEDISSEKRMKSTMSRYMDPGLADQLLAGGDDLLGGKNIVATVLFSDIRGFTTITEELGAQGTVSLLNEYFTIMVECIQGEGGMLDKFIGDAIMAAFGIPFAHDDDEDRGVRAAISMITGLDEWNKKRLAAGKKPVDMGIGLNTDNVVTGNIGSPKRMDYTIIGDGVNLAARLESACKQYSARILISEGTFKKLRGTYRIREVDLVVVKGKTKPATIYEVLDYHSDETFPNLMEVVNHFKDGVDLYRKADWDKAVSAFKKAMSLHPNDKLSQMYIDRCEHFKENSPGNDWNGIWIMKSK